MNINDEHKEFFAEPVYRDLLQEYRDYLKSEKDVSFPGFMTWMEEKIATADDSTAAPRDVEVLELGQAAHALAEIKAREADRPSSDAVELIIDLAQEEPNIPSNIERGYN